MQNESKLSKRNLLSEDIYPTKIFTEVQNIILRLRIHFETDGHQETKTNSRQYLIKKNAKLTKKSHNEICC
jgi:hypothetical protein